MVHSRRRTSLLGLLALVAGAVALVLTRFNPTGIETVPNLPVTLKLPAAAAIAATALALIAFLAAASSRRTGAGVPLIAVLVGGAALVLAFKPHRFSRPSAAPAARPTPALAAQPSVRASSPADGGEHRVKTIFDSNYPSSTPDVKPTVSHLNLPDSPAVPAPDVTRPDPAAALRAARTNVEAAREKVLRSIESTPAYQAAKADADAADVDLKQARLAYDPGSPELIAASQAALQAHSRLQKLVSNAAAHDPASQEADRELKAAQAAK